MNSEKVIKELNKRYPNKSVFVSEGEIVCEIEPTSEHPGYSIAIAVIDKSENHYHLETTEEYNVIKGRAKLYIDGEEFILEEGDKFTIEPGQKHYVIGQETWVECKSTPGWRKDDYIIVND